MKLIISSLVCVLLLASAPFSSRAEGRFQVGTRLIDAPEGGQYAAHFLYTDSIQLRFLPPPQWNVISDQSQQRLIIVSRDEKKKITLQLTATNDAFVPALNIDMLAQQVRSSFPDGQLLNSGNLFLAGGKGYFFDLTRLVGPLRLQTNVRVAFLESSHGYFQVTMSAPATDFQALNAAFGAFIGSLDPKPLPKRDS